MPVARISDVLHVLRSVLGANIRGMIIGLAFWEDLLDMLLNRCFMICH